MKKEKVLLLTALMVFALNLRSPLTSLSPIIGQLQSDIGISSALAGMLTTIPVLCFGILTPFASAFISRTGIEPAITASLIGIVIGTIVRSLGGFELAIVGTVILGAALTVGNIVSLLVIARDFSQHSNSVTGAYTSALNVGTMLTSALTAPLAAIIGWRMAISSWAWLAIAAGLLWLTVILVTKSKNEELSQRHLNKDLLSEGKHNKQASYRKQVWKRGIVWMLVAAFALHLFLYYAITAWLPKFLADVGGLNIALAGIAASTFQILALVGAFGVPALAATNKFSNIVLLRIISLCWLLLPIGLLISPDMWMLWALIGGIAQGGGFTILFMLIVEYSHDLDENRRISSIVQGIGYTFASLGPIIVGKIHQVYQGWNQAFILLFVIAFVLLIVSYVLKIKASSSQTPTKMHGNSY